jgi:hypothetical protein
MPHRTPRLYVETWAPDFGAALEPTEAPPLDPGDVDFTVELNQWRPLTGEDDGEAETVAFVDGVRRVDARLTLDDPAAGPVPGLCCSFAVGAVVWDRRVPRAEVRDVAVHRVAVLAEGRAAVLPPLELGLAYRAETVEVDDPGVLMNHLLKLMRNEEGRLAVDLARAGHLVIADGPIKALEAEPVVGCVKRHRRSYLTGGRGAVVAALRPGQRTPLFAFDVEGYQRYSWYVRLADVLGGHSWSGIVRCECTASLPLPRARLLAHRTAALLPQVASAQHLDPRAPQNLAPIAALERHLKRMLGDSGLVYRALLAAVAGQNGATPAPEPVAAGAAS